MLRELLEGFELIGEDEYHDERSSSPQGNFVGGEYEDLGDCVLDQNENALSSDVGRSQGIEDYVHTQYDCNLVSDDENTDWQYVGLSSVDPRSVDCTRRMKKVQNEECVTAGLLALTNTSRTKKKNEATARYLFQTPGADRQHVVSVEKGMMLKQHNQRSDPKPTVQRTPTHPAQPSLDLETNWELEMQRKLEWSGNVHSPACRFDPSHKVPLRKLREHELKCPSNPERKCPNAV
mmetsp:Transcript_13473/g.26915  ORF Transcript_13473/g.26915 Transcript_13473/m.26915 type:complete len:235 (+) Transcript_13473:44-748(+)